MIMRPAAGKRIYMKIIIPAIVLFSMIAFQTGCSGGAANTANADTNANTAAVSPFAHITDPKAALAEGDRLLDNNQTEQAIEAYKQAVTLDPDFAEAHFKMGIAYALIESEMQQAGNTVETTSNTGKGGTVKTNSQKAFERAVEAYKKVIAANPKDDLAQFNLGRAYNKLNKDEEAEAAFKQAVKLKPDDTEYQTEYGSILIKLAQYREALAPLKKALELDPENSRASDLLEDAEAGTKRIDFVQRDDANTKRSNSNTAANANVAADSNSAPKPPNANTKPQREDPKEKKPERPSNKP